MRIALRHPDGREVDLHPLTFRDDGTGIQQGLDTTTYEYPPDDIVSGQIGNRTVRCISVGLQIEFHSGYPHREVDRADVAVLKVLNERTAR